MSINLNITVPVDLKTIAELKSGMSLSESVGGSDCKRNLVKALKDAVVELPYNIIPAAIVPDDRFGIAVHTLAGKWVQLQVQRDMTTESIAYMVRDHIGVPNDQISFMHIRRLPYYDYAEDEKMVAVDDRSLEEIGIRESSILRVVAVLRGS